jgi:DNA-binding beta-propeller fold protein YncE
VGHLFSGVSSIDLGCADARGVRADRPFLSRVNGRVFPGLPEGVTSLTLGQPGDPTAPLFASGHDYSGQEIAAAITPLYLRSTDAASGAAGSLACPAPPTPPTGAGKRGFELVDGLPFYSSAFYPNGSDIRGLVLSPDGKRMYALHRNSGRSSPAAVVSIDRTPDERGRPRNRAIDSVEVCGGGTQLSWHDSGRGPRLFVVCSESGQVYVVDPELMIVSAVINAGRGPNAMAFSAADPTVAFLTGFTDNNVSVIDLRPGAVTEYHVVQRLGFPRAAGQ